MDKRLRNFTLILIWICLISCFVVGFISAKFTAGDHSHNMHLGITANYAVTYDPNGGCIVLSPETEGDDPHPAVVSSEPSVKILEIGSFYGPFPDVVRTGYSFAGWVCENDLNTPLREKSLMLTPSDHRVTARWIPNRYKVTLDTNKGRGTTEPEGFENGTAINVTYDSTFEGLPTLTRTGYTFIGWFDKNGDQYTAEDLVRITENITLQAKWEALKGNIFFDAGEGTITGENEYVQAEFDEVVNIPEAILKNHLLREWTSGTGISAEGSFYGQLRMACTGDMTLYANWEEQDPRTDAVVCADAPEKLSSTSYTFTFRNDSDIPQFFHDIVCEDNAGFTCTLYEILDDGNLGQLWPAAGTAGKSCMLPGGSSIQCRLVLEEIIPGSIPDEEELLNTLHIRFGRSFNFNINGGDEQPLPTYYMDSRQPQKMGILAPKKTGYKFLGWFDDPNWNEGHLFFDTENNLNDSIELTKELEGITLYAGWEPVHYTVIIKGAGSSDIESDDYIRLKSVTSQLGTYVDPKVYISKTDSCTLEAEMKVTSMSQWNFGTNGYMQYRNTVYPDSADRDLQLVIDYNGKTFQENVTENGVKQYSNNWGSSFNGTNCNVGIMRMGDSNKGWYGSGGGTVAEIFSIKITKNDELIRNMLPALRLSDGMAGLYDIVNEEFYPSAAASKPFSAGDTLITHKTLKLSYDESFDARQPQLEKEFYSIVELNTKADGSGRTYPYIQNAVNFSETDGEVLELYPIYYKEAYFIFNGLKSAVSEKVSASAAAPENDSTALAAQITGWFDLDGVQYFDADGNYCGPSIFDIKDDINLYIRYDFSRDYVAIPYIIATGSQFIDTGVPASNTKDICVDLSFESADLPSFCFGANAYLQFPESPLKLTEPTDIRLHWISATSTLSVYQNGTNLYNKGWGYYGTSNIGIFAMGYNSGWYSGSYGKGMLKAVTITEDGQVVRDMIPLHRISDGANGMYDIINGQFYTSVLSGTNFGAPEQQ